MQGAFKFENEGMQKALLKFKREVVAPLAKALRWDFDDGGSISTKHKGAMFEDAAEAGDLT